MTFRSVPLPGADRFTTARARRIRFQARSRTVLVATLAALALCACGSEDAPGSERETVPSSGAKPTVSAGSLPSVAPGAAQGLNVLLVTFDTVRADALACYGDERVRTPTVDRLAAQGVLFTRALAPTPITLPSHATLLTGLDPLSHGVRNNGTFQLAEEHHTLAEILGDSGYDTAAVVAAFVLDARYGVHQGFASYDDDVHLDGVAAGEGHFRERNATQVTDRALEWLAKHDANAPEKPFFLWTHYFDAHAPYNAPAEHILPGLNTDPNAPYDADLLRGRYLSEIAYADAELGRLLESLGEERLANTLVVFTADHGEGLGEHGEFTHSRLIYDSTMRVPLVISSPKLFARAAVVDDRVVGLVDVAPTLLSMLGLQARTKLDGQSLFEAPRDGERTIYGESMVTFYNHGWAPLHSLSRLGDKAIRAPRPEYYDVRKDPAELQNLHATQRATAEPLLAKLETTLGAAKSVRPAERELESDEAKGLAELGYSRSTPSGSTAGSIDPKDAIVTWAVLTNAQTYSAQGQYDRALADVRRVLATNPNDPFAWETEYVVHLRRGALPEAETALRKVVELYPTSEALVRLAWLYYQQSKFAECEAAAAQAEKLEPDHGDIFLIRGELHYRAQRYEEALEQFERALLVDPGRVAEKARKGIDAARKALPGGS
jgi:arylsulfatase A-like enzyme/Tfp pilus assembly protein PilF